MCPTWASDQGNFILPVSIVTVATHPLTKATGDKCKLFEDASPYLNQFCGAHYM